MLQELPHTTFPFQIAGISFILKLYAVKDDLQKIIPVVDLKIIQGDIIEEARGFRVPHLHFFSTDQLSAIETLSYITSWKEGYGYNAVQVHRLEVDYGLIGDYYLKLLVNDDKEGDYSYKLINNEKGEDELIEKIEEKYTGVLVQEKDKVIFKSESGHINLQAFIKSIDIINQGINDFFITHNLQANFFDRFPYDGQDSYHRELIKGIPDNFEFDNFSYKEKPENKICTQTRMDF